MSKLNCWPLLNNEPGENIRGASLTSLARGVSSDPRALFEPPNDGRKSNERINLFRGYRFRYRFASVYSLRVHNIALEELIISDIYISPVQRNAWLTTWINLRLKRMLFRKKKMCFDRLEIHSNYGWTLADEKLQLDQKLVILSLNERVFHVIQHIVYPPVKSIN